MLLIKNLIPREIVSKLVRNYNSPKNEESNIIQTIIGDFFPGHMNKCGGRKKCSEKESKEDRDKKKEERRKVREEKKQAKLVEKKMKLEKNELLESEYEKRELMNFILGES